MARCDGSFFCTILVDMAFGFCCHCFDIARSCSLDNLNSSIIQAQVAESLAMMTVTSTVVVSSMRSFSKKATSRLGFCE